MIHWNHISSHRDGHAPHSRTEAKKSGMVRATSHRAGSQVGLHSPRYPRSLQASLTQVLQILLTSAVQSTTNLQLHVFADPSPKAYGTVDYISNGDQSSLIMSKSRVAPLKKLTLPKLKLMAASICTRLAHFVAEALKISFSNFVVHRWSLCEIVLHWLHSSKPPKQFIANRTKEIKALLPVSVRNHCPTHENPADLLNHGITTTQLHTSSIWQYGPQWLPLVEQWPSWNSSICNCVTSPMQKILMPKLQYQDHDRWS